MKKIQYKATILFQYLIGFSLGTIAAIILSSAFNFPINDGKEFFLLIAAGYMLGVIVPKKIFGFLILADDKIYLKIPPAIAAILFSILFLTATLFAFIALSPLYVIYFMGYLFGKGFKTASSTSKGEA